MKLYYIAEFKTIEKNYLGVKLKIEEQIKAFINKGFDINKIDVCKKVSFINKIVSKIPLIGSGVVLDKLDNINYGDFVYIRYFKSNYRLLKKLKSLKSKNVNILIEIPTYPYDNEQKINFKNFNNIMEDRFFRNYLYKYVDKIVTYSEDKKIFGIDTINISNGLNGENIKLKENKVLDKNEINFIAVAAFSEWHGYDRAIKGLKDYYEKNRDLTIKIHFVGDGKVIDIYKEMVNEFNLNNKVIFHGKKHGKDLDEIYEICDIGLDAMGRHRSKVYYNSSLKGKEYLFRGIPIVSGVKTELDYDKNFKYYYRVSADDKNLDFNEIIKFYKNLNFNIDSKLEMRKYAEDNFSMNNCLNPVIEYLLEN